MLKRDKPMLNPHHLPPHLSHFLLCTQALPSFGLHLPCCKSLHAHQHASTPVLESLQHPEDWQTLLHTRCLGSISAGPCAGIASGEGGRLSGSARLATRMPSPWGRSWSPSTLRACTKCCSCPGKPLLYIACMRLNGIPDRLRLEPVDSARVHEMLQLSRQAFAVHSVHAFEWRSRPSTSGALRLCARAQNAAAVQASSQQFPILTGCLGMGNCLRVRWARLASCPGCLQTSPACGAHGLQHHAGIRLCRRHLLSS